MHNVKKPVINRVKNRIYAPLPDFKNPEEKPEKYEDPNLTNKNIPGAQKLPTEFVSNQEIYTKVELGQIKLKNPSIEANPEKQPATTTPKQNETLISAEKKNLFDDFYNSINKISADFNEKNLLLQTNYVNLQTRAETFSTEHASEFSDETLNDDEKLLSEKMQLHLNDIKKESITNAKIVANKQLKINDALAEIIAKAKKIEEKANTMDETAIKDELLLLYPQDLQKDIDSFSESLNQQYLNGYEKPLQDFEASTLLAFAKVKEEKLNAENLKVKANILKAAFNKKHEDFILAFKSKYDTELPVYKKEFANGAGYYERITSLLKSNLKDILPIVSNDTSFYDKAFKDYCNSVREKLSKFSPLDQLLPFEDKTSEKDFLASEQQIQKVKRITKEQADFLAKAQEENANLFYDDLKTKGSSYTEQCDGCVKKAKEYSLSFQKILLDFENFLKAIENDKKAKELKLKENKLKRDELKLQMQEKAGELPYSPYNLNRNYLDAKYRVALPLIVSYIMNIEKEKADLIEFEQMNQRPGNNITIQHAIASFQNKHKSIAQSIDAFCKNNFDKTPYELFQDISATYPLDQSSTVDDNTKIVFDNYLETNNKNGNKVTNFTPEFKNAILNTIASRGNMPFQNINIFRIYQETAKNLSAKRSEIIGSFNLYGANDNDVVEKINPTTKKTEKIKGKINIAKYKAELADAEISKNKDFNRFFSHGSISPTTNFVNSFKNTYTDAAYNLALSPKMLTIKNNTLDYVPGSASTVINVYSR